MSRLKGLSLNKSFVSSLRKYGNGKAMKELIGDISYDFAIDYIGNNPIRGKPIQSQAFGQHDVYFSTDERYSLISAVGKNLNPGIGENKTNGRVVDLAMRRFLENANKVGAKTYDEYRTIIKDFKTEVVKCEINLLL